MERFGFREVARSYYEPQHDLVYINTRLLAQSRHKITIAVTLARVISVLTGGKYRDHLERKLLGWREWRCQSPYHMR